MNTFRFYSFTHAWLSAGAAGLQTAHAVSELSLTDCEIYKKWAKDDKTIIILNGGNSQMLDTTLKTLVELRASSETISSLCSNVVAFREDNESLEGIRTVVGIIVHERLFNAKADEFDESISPFYHWIGPSTNGEGDIVSEVYRYGSPEFTFIDHLKKHQFWNF